MTERVELSSEVRERRIGEVQSDIATDKDTIMLLEKEKQKCTSMSKFCTAAQINEQISCHRKSTRDNQQVLAKLQKPETRSQKYYKDSAEAKKAKKEKLKKTTKEQATVTELLSTGSSFSQSEMKHGTKQSTAKESLAQQEEQDSSHLVNAFQQDLDQHTATQRMPITSSADFSQNAMQQDFDHTKIVQKMPDGTNTSQSIVQQGDDQHTVGQSMPATSSTSTSQNAMQENVNQPNVGQKMPHSTNTSQSTMQQGEDHHTVAQRMPATSSASISQNAM